MLWTGKIAIGCGCWFERKAEMGSVTRTIARAWEVGRIAPYRGGASPGCSGKSSRFRQSVAPYIARNIEPPQGANAASLSPAIVSSGDGLGFMAATVAFLNRLFRRRR